MSKKVSVNSLKNNQKKDDISKLTEIFKDGESRNVPAAKWMCEELRKESAEGQPPCLKHYWKKVSIHEMLLRCENCKVTIRPSLERKQTNNK